MLGNKIFRSLQTMLLSGLNLTWFDKLPQMLWRLNKLAANRAWKLDLTYTLAVAGNFGGNPTECRCITKHRCIQRFIVRLAVYEKIIQEPLALLCVGGAMLYLSVQIFSGSTALLSAVFWYLAARVNIPHPVGDSYAGKGPFECAMKRQTKLNAIAAGSAAVTAALQAIEAVVK
ncbi:hypothetical protein [Rhodopila sp.]|uniref:hypothetical protein n=1 Tax=Rhodopila sp. TaxID=2480087 RepID=UPI003D0B87D5